MAVFCMKALQEEEINKVSLIAFQKNEGGNQFWRKVGWTFREDLNYTASSEARPEDIEFAGAIFSALGLAVQLPESSIDAVTALSGSGPAYVFEFIQALADGGVAEGLPRNIALQLAVQTVIGSARMVAETGEHPTQLKDNVTSPGGTTSRALEVMAERGFAGVVIQSVRAAAQRSRELGGK